MVVDKETSELLKYDYQKKEKYVSIDKEVLKRHPVIEYRNDLLDCEIDICSPDVCIFLIFRQFFLKKKIFFFRSLLSLPKILITNI